MSRILFYGINGVGLGHIARLSLVQRYLAHHYPEQSTEAICRSKMGPQFFTCPCISVGKRGREVKALLGVQGITWPLKALWARVFPSKRKTILLDTHWPRRLLNRLHASGHRTFLITEVNKPEILFEDLQKSMRYFEKIYFPSEWDELEFHYKEHPELWALLQHEKVEAIGPFVRITEKSDDGEKVIFTLGGGGDHDAEDPKYSVRGYIEEYVKAATILQDAGKTQLYLAKGPLMEIDVELGPLKVLETMNLPEHFGPNTTVVTRGTFNLCWETIAAGAKLVTTTRSTVLAEHAESRNAYLEQKGYAYYVELDGAALAEAILRNTPEQIDEGQALILAQPGLARIGQALTQPKSN